MTPEQITRLVEAITRLAQAAAVDREQGTAYLAEAAAEDAKRVFTEVFGAREVAPWE
jgi:hypothetical protein